MNSTARRESAPGHTGTGVLIGGPASTGAQPGIDRFRDRGGPLPAGIHAITNTGPKPDDVVPARILRRIAARGRYPRRRGDNWQPYIGGIRSSFGWLYTYACPKCGAWGHLTARLDDAIAQGIRHQCIEWIPITENRPKVQRRGLAWTWYCPECMDPETGRFYSVNHRRAVFHAIAHIPRCPIRIGGEYDPIPALISGAIRSHYDRRARLAAML